MNIDEYNDWKYGGISHERIEFITSILEVTVSCNDKKHIKHEAVASSRNFVLDSKIINFLDKDKETNQIFWKLVMNSKKNLKQCFEIRQWTRWLADNGFCLSTRYGNDFETFEVLDDVVQVCIQDIVRNYSGKIYDLCLEYCKNTEFKQLYMADTDSCLCTCEEGEKEECEENSCKTPKWKKIIEEDAENIRQKMVEHLKRTGERIKKLSKEEIITDKEYKNLFPIQIVKKAFEKIKRIEISAKKRKMQNP